MNDNKNKLSIQGIWESKTSDFKIINEATETTSEVDGVHILARVEGPAFFPNTTSGNGVFYPLEAWQNALNDEDFQYRLGQRLVLGTIGHEIELGDDEVRKGELSHIVTKAWIDEDNVGRAEYLILGTGPGKVLNTLLRAKCGLRVSTKANGLFKGNTQEVDPDNFFFERIDFVLDPGYREAFPALVESFYKERSERKNKINETASSQTSGEDTAMNEALDAKLIADKEAQIKQLKYQLARVQEKLSKYEEYGTLPAIREAYDSLNEYIGIGSVTSISSAINEASNIISKALSKKKAKSISEADEDNKEGEGLDDIQTEEFNLDDLDDSISELDSEVSDNPDADETNVDDTIYDSPEDLKDLAAQAEDAVQALTAYAELGTPEEIQKVFDAVAALAEVADEAELTTVSEALKIPKATLSKIISKSQIKQLHEDLVAADTDAWDTYEQQNEDALFNETVQHILASLVDVPEDVVYQDLIGNDLLLAPYYSVGFTEEDLLDILYQPDQLYLVLSGWKTAAEVSKSGPEDASFDSVIAVCNNLMAQLGASEYNDTACVDCGDDNAHSYSPECDCPQCMKYKEIESCDKSESKKTKLNKLKKNTRSIEIKEAAETVDLNALQDDSIKDSLNNFYKVSESKINEDLDGEGDADEDDYEDFEPVDDELVSQMQDDMIADYPEDIQDDIDTEDPYLDAEESGEFESNIDNIDETGLSTLDAVPQAVNQDPEIIEQPVSAPPTSVSKSVLDTLLDAKSDGPVDLTPVFPVGGPAPVSNSTFNYSNQFGEALDPSKIAKLTAQTTTNISESLNQQVSLGATKKSPAKAETVTTELLRNLAAPQPSKVNESVNVSGSGLLVNQLLGERFKTN